MKLSAAIGRFLLALVAVTVIQTAIGALVMTVPKTTQPTNGLPWLLLSNGLAVAALCVLALRSPWRGWRLGAAVAAVPLTIGCADAIEGAFFLTNSGIEWPRLFAYVILSWALTMPVWMLLFGRRAKPTTASYHPIASKPRGERVWKFIFSDLAYAFLYFTAGAIIFPYVKDFYATQQLPSHLRILAMQLLVRGPIFIVLCVALVRMLGLPRLSGALAVGVVFTLLSGITPLLTPNPFFPDSVRWVHLCEVSSSNFVFGVCVAWLWGQPNLQPMQSLRQAA
jgi:hypothetical protein